MINWFILSINGSPISWTRGRYSSDIDHVLVNSIMLDKISCAYFVDYPSVSGHKPFVVYCKKITTNKSFLLPKKKKNLFGRIGINVLNLKMKFVIIINLRL